MRANRFGLSFLVCVCAAQVSQWLLTLFAYALPLPHLLRVWDLAFSEGWKALFKVALAKLQVRSY